MDDLCGMNILLFGMTYVKIEIGMSKVETSIHFEATLLRPTEAKADDAWSFLRLPQSASDQLPSRSMVSVEGTINGSSFYATLEPDGQGGHWLRVDKELRESVRVKVGDTLEFEIAPMKEEPEPKVPEDLKLALEGAIPKVREVWEGTTAISRRDWIYWITSPKKLETRVRRIETALDKLAKGQKRACCFDRSGMYSKSLSCPVEAD